MFVPKADAMTTALGLALKKVGPFQLRPEQAVPEFGFEPTPSRCHPEADDSAGA
jgi:hypothetical protein